MERLKIYSVKDSYIEYLRNIIPNVYSNKEESRRHTRKYIGVVIEINEFKYYIPLSSPKKTDYQTAGNSKVIKKSIVPIIRIVAKNSNNIKELKGTLRISHMIPVPESELVLYDLENELDADYKNLVENEMVFIRKNKEKIINNAKVMYNQKINNDESANYVKMALNYKKLEELCLSYQQRG